MSSHTAIAAGRVAVITGGASGIGLAAAVRFAGLGLKVAIADVDAARLDVAKADVMAAGNGDVIAVQTDVSKKDDVERLCQRVLTAFGDVAVVMNNAGVEGGGGPFDNYAGWERVLGINLWGVINGVHVFAPVMIAQGRPGAIINTGSKQGITTPPGDTAYNVSKAGVKVITEGLQHTLRNTPGCAVSAHLFVPGWVHTPMTAHGRIEKPAGAWRPEQAIDMLLERMGIGDFYIICPDNDVSSDLDRKRIAWAAQDITENRPPLSRWHPDYKDAFAEFLKKDG